MIESGIHIVDGEIKGYIVEAYRIPSMATPHFCDNELEMNFGCVAGIHSHQ